MKRRPLCVLCIGLMIAIWLCRTAGIPVFGEPALSKEEKRLLQAGQETTLTGLVTDRRISSQTVRYTLRHVHVTIGDRKIPFSGIFVSTEYRDEQSAAEPGDLLRARGTIQPVERAGNPGQFDAGAYYASRKIYYRLWADDPPEADRRVSIRKGMYHLRSALTGMYDADMQEGPAGILSAMLMGDKAFLTEESRRNFQCGGCLHLLVISGLHVMLLGMGLLQILLRLRMPQTPACLTASACMVFYTALTGFPVAAMRACLMFLILVFARVLRKSYDSACAMALSAILLLLAEPGYLFHAGFQLSFAAAGAASLVTPLMKKSLSAVFSERAEKRARAEKRRQKDRRGRENIQERKRTFWKEQMRNLLRSGKESMILWGAVQLCTLPLTAWYFFEIPVWSLPMNLLLVPCVPYVLGAGVIGSLFCLVLPRAGKWLLFPADLGLGLFDRILRLSRSLPCSSVVCGRPALWQIGFYYAVLGGVLFVLRRKYGRNNPAAGERRTFIRCAVTLAAAFVLLFFRHWPGFSLTMLDVGQGDCIVIQRGRAAFLSDGGSTNVAEVGKYRILPYLEYSGTGYIGAVCISHNDADHMNGIEEILRMIAEKQTAVRIGCVCMPAWMIRTEDGIRIRKEACAAGADVRSLQRGEAITAGDLRIEVLHPFRQQESMANAGTADGTGSVSSERVTEYAENRTEQTGVRVVNSVPTGGAQSGNAGSVVLQVSYRGFTALLTGDLEKEGEEEMLPYLSDIDCLKAGHHGSRWSSSEEFLAVTRPEIALVSAPENSMYGHPHQEALDRLSAAGAKIFSTKDSGAVQIGLRRRKITVNTWKPGKGGEG